MPRTVLSALLLAMLVTLSLTPPLTAESLCADLPFVFNSFPTTSYGPAYADILTQPNATTTEMLVCSETGVEYALCFYSGPNSGDNPLPCKVDEELGTAMCECFLLKTSTAFPYMVDINSILNTCVYIETVRHCQSDGSGCTDPATNPPPVCQYIKDNSLWAGTKPPQSEATVTSTFSLAKASEYGGPAACTSCKGRYAGCMTAPCWKQPGNDKTVICECPLYEGEYQIGQNGVSCDAGEEYTWSAAYNTTTPFDSKECPSGMPAEPGE